MDRYLSLFLFKTNEAKGVVDGVWGLMASKTISIFDKNTKKVYVWFGKTYLLNEKNYFKSLGNKFLNMDKNTTMIKNL